MSVLDKITYKPLPTSQYINEVFKKSQIYLHHTASSPDPFAVQRYWISTQERVSTAFLVVGVPNSKKQWKDGEIVQCFGSNKGGWHLGLKAVDIKRGGPNAKSSTHLNMQSIGIEITNWGYLKPTEKGFMTYMKTIVPDDRVLEYTTPYRGNRYYERYTDAQIENARALLIYLCDKYDIDPKFKGMEIFNIDPRCLQGDNGIWTHTSCRKDKSDCHPQVELIQMLKSL